MSSGCLSIYYACVLQRIVGKRYKPDRIKDWLRLPPSRHDDEHETDDTVKASLSAVLIVSAPFSMVKVSIFSFLAGLAIYQGFTWTRGLDTSAGPLDSRNVFNTFMITTGSCALFFLAVSLAKDVESLLQRRRTTTVSVGANWVRGYLKNRKGDHEHRPHLADVGPPVP